jgi:HAD domain in Swiss Army Knife RNA repair proteins
LSATLGGKILFLDFDGVLHPNLAPEDGCFVRAPALAELIGGTGLQVVISSSWRFHHPLPHILDRLPAALRERVVGTTGEAIPGRFARWQEIRAWCQRHRASDWRALDDAAFEFPPGCPQLIRCDGALGVGEAEFALLRGWLAA